jgi:hypothetical protein
MVYILKRRAQHILVWNNALPQIRKPPHNRRLSPAEGLPSVRLLNSPASKQFSIGGHIWTVASSAPEDKPTSLR